MPSANLKQACHGLVNIPIQSQMTPYTAYPFGLHERSVLPWNIHINDNGLHLQSTGCRISAISGQPGCIDCQELHSKELLEGILDRMENGVHENAPYAYPYAYQPRVDLQKIRERKNSSLDVMRVGKVNTARKLRGKLGCHNNLSLPLGSSLLCVASTMGSVRLFRGHSFRPRRCVPTIG